MCPDLILDYPCWPDYSAHSVFQFLLSEIKLDPGFEKDSEAEKYWILAVDGEKGYGFYECFADIRKHSGRFLE